MNIDRYIVYIFLCWILLPGFSFRAVAQEIDITTSVDRNPVALDQQFTFKIKITGKSQNLPQPEFPELKGFLVLSGPHSSSSIRIINGVMSSSKTYSYSLLPQKTGKFTIPATSIVYQNKTYRSKPIQLIVKKEKASIRTPQRTGRRNGSQPKNNNKALFLRSFPSKKKIYLNEQLDVVYKMYFQETVRNLQYIKFPENIGFWVEEHAIKDIRVSREALNGVEYESAKLKQFALFPTKQGRLTITPLQLSLNIVERRKRRDPFDPFDGFFSNPFEKTTRKILKSNKLTIDVLPLPEKGKPEDFTGLVGTFQIKHNIDKTTITTNQAISLKIILSGSGNLKSLANLKLNLPESFEVYDPKIKDKNIWQKNKMISTKELEYVLIPRSPGKYRIKPLVLNYFDPSKKRYKFLKSPEYEIQVGKGKEIAGVAGISYPSRHEVKVLEQDIHFIKENYSEMTALGYKPYQAPWFWITLIFPLILLGGAYGYREHQQKMSTNIEFARKRKAFKQANQRLKEAQKLLSQGHFADFYAEISKGLIGFVADKTNHPAAGLLKDDVAKLLQEKRVEETLVNDYLKYLEEADFRRFAPATISGEQADVFYQQAEEMLVKLGKIL